MKGNAHVYRNFAIRGRVAAGRVDGTSRDRDGATVLAVAATDARAVAAGRGEPAVGPRHPGADHLPPGEAAQQPGVGRRDQVQRLGAPLFLEVGVGVHDENLARGIHESSR